MSKTLTLNAKSSILLLLLAIGVGLGGVMPQSFADHSEVTIVPTQGSGAPGCEEVQYGCYIPGVATVDLGGKVIFLNDDSAAHTFSAGTAADGPTGEFDTSMVMAGQSYEWTADVAGEIDYFCMVHPWMVGLLIVEEAGAETSNSESTLSVDEKLEFGAGLEEALGHFWALEQNLDDNNAELALIHATHPIAELYDAMKPQLKATDPALDDKVQNTLLDLKDKASTDVSRTAAQSAIDDAKDVVEIARSTVVGQYWSDSTNSQLYQMKTLLETSIAEYAEAVEDGVIGEMAEFQDGSAFVWRSQVIFDEIKSDLSSHPAEEIEELFDDVKSAYNSRSSPSDVDTLTSGIIHEIDEITGVEGEDTELTLYVDEINELLTQAKQEYAAGDTDLALSLVTKAYLDNFEFLEAPLIEAGERELMEEVEVMMREELRSMIKNGASSSEVDSQIDAILIKMTTVEQVVPEFGSIAILILVAAIIGSVLFARKSSLVFPRI